MMRKIFYVAAAAAAAAVLSGCAWFQTPEDEALCPGGQNCPQFQPR